MAPADRGSLLLLNSMAGHHRWHFSVPRLAMAQMPQLYRALRAVVSVCFSGCSQVHVRLSLGATCGSNNTGELSAMGEARVGSLGQKMPKGRPRLLTHFSRTIFMEESVSWLMDFMMIFMMTLWWLLLSLFAVVVLQPLSCRCSRLSCWLCCCSCFLWPTASLHPHAASFHLDKLCCGQPHCEWQMICRCCLQGSSARGKAQ